MQAEPNFEGAVALDHRGDRFVLGRTAEAYAVWPLSGGAAVRTFPQQEQHWAAAWQAFQDLEAGRQTPEASPMGGGSTPALSPSGPPPEGLVVMDYQGRRYGVGRTRDAYAIWDLSRGGPPIETHPLSEAGWLVAWRRYQEREAGDPGSATKQPSVEAASEPATPAPTTAPGELEPDLEGAAAVDYRGSGYALGRTAQGYAIWDVGAGGEPILTFPATPEAWNQAWGAYQRLEGARGG